jgi:chromosome segregation ATPase
MLLISTYISFSDETLDECIKSLDESTELLESAFNRIEELEKENKSLKEKLDQDSEKEIKELKNKIEKLKREKEDIEVSLIQASKALEESNLVLDRAYGRISKDQKEIERLRDNIHELINAGVEVKTHNWSMSILAGYPYEVGFNINYNLHWMPNLGIIVGGGYDIEHNMPKVNAGLRINFD